MSNPLPPLNGDDSSKLARLLLARDYFGLVGYVLSHPTAERALLWICFVLILGCRYPRLDIIGALLPAAAAAHDTMSYVEVPDHPGMATPFPTPAGRFP